MEPIHLTINLTIHAGDGCALVLGSSESEASVITRPAAEVLTDALRRAIADILRERATQRGEM